MDEVVKMSNGSVCRHPGEHLILSVVKFTNSFVTVYDRFMHRNETHTMHNPSVQCVLVKVLSIVILRPFDVIVLHSLIYIPYTCN